MDLLVKLYQLSSAGEESGSYNVRRAFAAEKHAVVNFVAKNFSDAWAGECDVAFARQPVACFIAVANDALSGFACYDATARGFFGPAGVLENRRNQGIGSALLRATLMDMRANGYAYAIIGGVSHLRFYQHVGATEIADSTPGFYNGMLKAR